MMNLLFARVCRKLTIETYSIYKGSRKFLYPKISLYTNEFAPYAKILAKPFLYDHLSDEVKL